MNDPKLYTFLALLGAVPFAAGAALSLAGVASLPLVGDVGTATALYGLGIVCFLTGIHWATQLYLPTRSPFNLFIASNVVFLIVLGAFLAASIEVALAAQILGLLAILAIDVRLRRAELLSAGYLRVRYAATAIGGLSLLAVAVSG